MLILSPYTAILITPGLDRWYVPDETAFGADCIGRVCFHDESDELWQADLVDDVHPCVDTCDTTDVDYEYCAAYSVNSLEQTALRS